MIKKTLKYIRMILLIIGLIYVIYSIFSFGYHIYNFRNNGCIKTSLGCNNECQDKIDECFKNNCKPGVECYCPNDCEYYANTTGNNDNNILPEEIITIEEKPSDEDRPLDEVNLIDENETIDENKPINDNESIDEVIDLDIDNTMNSDSLEWVDLLGLEDKFLKRYSTKSPEEVRKAVNIIKTKVEKKLEEDEEIYLGKLSCKSSDYIYCHPEGCECSDSYQKDKFERYDVIINETKGTKDYIIIGKKKKSASNGGINEEGKWISPNAESNLCPQGKVYQCPMGLCKDEETGDLYPCQHTCFCTDPNVRF